MPDRETPLKHGGAPARDLAVWLIPVLLLATLAAYGNSFSVPFLFDDHDVLEHNPSIHSLATGLFPPGKDGMTVSGRPLVNMTLAVNHAVSGLDVWSYHALNLAIHALAGLTLFGLVRRTLRRPSAGRAGPKADGSADLIAAAAALVWLLHPLQTESVTYISQRAESLVSLFYLLTLYCFARSADGRSERGWQALSVACCVLGMASKEVMVSAPLLVFLFDRTFVSGTFRGAWVRRRGFYLSLACSWLLLGWLVAGTAGRGGTAGAEAHVSGWAYALTQCPAVIHYLWLSLWPHPLIFDYGVGLRDGLLDVAVPAAALLGLLVATGIALKRKPALGFLGVLFFAVLAPSSSVVPVATQTMAEHRMYLPLAAVVLPMVIGLHAWLGRAGLAVCVAWAAGLGCLTALRNQDYQSALSLWKDTAEKRPSNSRAHANYGAALSEAGRQAEAAAELELSLKIGPELASAHFNLGLIASESGQTAEARRQFEEAIRMSPNYAEARINLGVIMLDAGEKDQGALQLEEAVRLAPEMHEAHANYGNALAQTGRLPAALGHYAEAIRLDPGYAPAHYNYGNALFALRRLEDAAKQFEIAAHLEPGNVAALFNLGFVLAQLQRPGEARAALEAALRIKPDLRSAQELLKQLPPKP